ncbi:MAG TPA: nucleoside triphosphate pyrophosphohydrolase [Deltaproteobacteria bacterium]|nr:nucleoside triphosphate pyrophosphohydrolase [Deltaproteobacteria bacterium]
MNLPPLENQSTAELFTSLLQVMDELRGPNGCPWDKKQTPESLLPCLLEETYEVIEAIDAKNPQSLREELGDLLLQVVFHSRIGKESGEFEMRDVLIQLIDKLVRRHPHVFAKGEVKEAEAALRQWEEIKSTEKDPKESRLAGVPLQLPALARAERLGAKASRAGFDWPDAHGVLAKVGEELQELHQEIAAQSAEQIEEEFGDLLFSLAQTARFLKVHPEEALRKSTLKFQRRFEKLEADLRGQGKKISDCSPQELDRLWEAAKSSTNAVKKL